SINLAILNLLPIPILDGGQLMFLIAEAVRGRPLSRELRTRLSNVGFFLLVVLLILALTNDALRILPRYGRARELRRGPGEGGAAGSHSRRRVLPGHRKRERGTGTAHDGSDRTSVGV